MKKSKIKLLCSTIILIFIISIIYLIISINKVPNSKYKENQIIDKTGQIINCLNNKIVLKSDEKILINNYNTKCILGKTIRVKGIITKPSTFQNLDLFNYQKYLYSQRIIYTLKPFYIKYNNKKVPTHYKIKNNLIKKLKKYKSKDYLNAFILGDNKEISKNIINSYRNNGISHLLAISGMHITVLSSVLLFILNIIKKTKINYLFVICMLLFYSFLTAFSPSVIRATFLFIALTLNKIFKFKIPTIYFIILFWSINILINPYIIYNLGFNLSYIVTLFLIINSKLIKKEYSYFKKVFIISSICFISSLPLLIYNFHQINLLSPFLNIIFVPFVSIIIYPLSIITLIIKPLDDILLICLKAMENLSLILEKIDILNITLKHINIYLFIIYYIFIYYVLKKFNKKYIILFIIIIFMHNNINYLSNDIKITMLDVSQGDSALIQFNHNKKNILIDTGGIVSYDNKKSYALAPNVTIPYLKKEGIKKLHYLILTHGDYDHMGEAINLVNNFKVEKVIFNCGKFNDLEQELIKVLNKKKIKYYSCIKELNIDNNKLYFLQTKEYDNENDNSNVIYTELDGYKFMFMGDAGIDKERDILNKYNLPDIDVLKVGHHGSRTSSGKEFINEINPKYSVISVGKNNRYGHPNKEVLKNLVNSKIYRTDKNGSIMFKIKNNKLKIETCSP